MRCHYLTLPAFLLIGCVFLAPPAQADTLLPAQSSPPVGNGTSFAFSSTLAPNNYPVASSNNTLQTFSTLLTAASPLDLVLQSVNSAGTTQYNVSSSVFNNTGTAFSSVSFELGTGTGTNFIPLAASSTAIFFYNSPAPASASFSTVSLTKNTLTFSGGSLGQANADTFTYSLVTPDQPTTASTFTLREFTTVAAVPELSTFLGFGGFICLGGLAAFRQRKQARKAV